jgi:hypothetical protein
MTAQEAYCLHCFEMLPACVEVCPHCGNNLIEQHQQSYAVRLINALAHPLADIRMRVIIKPLGYQLNTGQLSKTKGYE